MALLLFGVFAACVLMVLLTGADAYRRLTRRDQAAFERRTGIQYIATRVRQSDSLDGLAVENFGGVDALVLGAGEEYVTRIYCYDGELMELYAAADLELTPEDGERIMAVDWLELKLEDGLLKIGCIDEGGSVSQMSLSLRSGEGGAE